MPQATKLAETMIAGAALAPDQKKAWLWDTLVTGFGVRLRSGGSKTFWYQYRPPGGRSVTARMIRIGAWPSISVNDARKVARAHAGAVALGANPAAEREETERRIGSTLRQLLAADGEYERHLKRRQIVNTKVVMSGLTRGLAGLMSKDVKDITRQDFVTAITTIEDAGKPGAAEDLRKFARTFCEWCVARGLTTANVMAGLRRPKQTRAEKLARRKRKPRALADHEIVAVWNACQGRGSFGNVIRLLLLSGARRGEIAKLERQRILSDRLVLPPQHTKMGEPHEVSLSDLMRGVIASQPKTTSRLVFPSEKTGGHIQGWTKLVAGLQKDSGAMFTPHDLRRTCRTLMSRLGVADDIAELAIGHQREGLERLYDFDQALQLRCDAFAKVTDHIARLLEQGTDPGRVVAISARPN